MILKTANGLASGPNAISALLTLARLVGREYAYDNLLRQLGSGNVEIDSWIYWEAMAAKYEIRQIDAGGERVWLEWDAVIAVPWSMDRVIRNFRELSLGPAGGGEPWVPDPRSHHIALWMPMRLAKVWEGNHSITAGMLCNGGSVPATVIFDLTPLLDALAFYALKKEKGMDKLFWKDRRTGEIIQIYDWRLGALFEIGRHLRNLDFDGRLRDWRP